MSTTTTHFGLGLPGINDPIYSNQWGYILNNDMVIIDGVLYKLWTSNIGASRPTDAAAGTLWIDNTANPWVVYIFDGTNDVSIGTLDTISNQFNPSNASGITSITKPSDTTYTVNITATDPHLTFTLLANKKYIVKSFIMANSLVSWPGNGGSFQMNFICSNPYTNVFLSREGSKFVPLPSSHAIATSFLYYTTGSTDIQFGNYLFRTVSGSLVNNSPGPIYFSSESKIETGASNITFTTSVTAAGSGSANFTLDTGSYITYQEIN